MELFKILGTVAIDNQDANKALDETTGKAEQTHSRLSTAFNKVGGAAVKVGKVMATGLAAGATAFTGLATKALNLGGELEQNMGGSEAVFGEYAQSMQDKASRAFSKMGLSASGFLATANKMGALFQGAGFGIEESADLSAEAMQRAADVASIMGIDTAAAMEAVAGAAKGNFTMMDNLGVAMNETALANYALEKGLEKSYSAMTQQEKIGLAMEMFLDKTSYAAGNYAKENETLAGSLGTAKAAFENFLTGAGTVEDVVDSVLNAASVIMTRIQELLPRLVEGVNQLITQLMPHLPAIIETLLPGIITGAVSLMTGLIGALPMIVQILIEQIPFILLQIGKALIQAFPALFDTVKNLFVQIWDFIADGLRNIGIDFEGAFANIKGIFQDAWGWLKDVWENVGKPIFKGITDFLSGVFTGNWKKAWEGVKSILTGIFNGILTGIETMINGGINAINRLIGGINKLVGKAGKALGLNVEIPTIPTVTLPKLEEGGVLEKGQMGLLEGNGAEAVVPLERNRAWISAVARDMRDADIGGGDVLIQYMEQLIELLTDFFPQLLEAAGHDIVANDGAILARYAPLMNAELGRISIRKDRGR